MPDRLLPVDLVNDLQAHAIANVVEVPDHTNPAFNSGYFADYKPERLRLGLTVNL